MSKVQRQTLKMFKDAGLDVEVVNDKKHWAVYHAGVLVHAMSHGTKEPPRVAANIRRKIRRIKEGKSRNCK